MANYMYTPLAPKVVTAVERISSLAFNYSRRLHAPTATLMRLLSVQSEIIVTERCISLSYISVQRQFGYYIRETSK